MLKLIMQWHVWGTVLAVLFVVIVAACGGSWSPLDDDPSVDALASGAMAAAFLVGATPLAIAFLFAWVKLSERYPTIERKRPLQCLLLVGLTTIVVACASVSTIALANVPQIFSEGLGFSSQLFASQLGDIAWVCVFSGVWAVAPRFVIPSLRSPLCGNGRM